MAGNPDNVRIWTCADVWVAFDPDTAVIPIDENEVFDATWSLVGLLNGEDGMSETGEFNINDDHYDWCGNLVRTNRSQHKKTLTFMSIETNAVTNRLAYPGSTASTIAVPTIERVKVAIELRDEQNGVIQRKISAGEAEVELEGGSEELNNSDLAGRTFLTTLYTDVNGVYWTLQPDQAYQA